MKIINFILNLTAAIAIFIVGIAFVKFVCEFSEVPKWLCYIVYFGAGVVVYHPIKYIFNH